MAQPLKDHEYNPRDEKPVIGPEPLSGNAKPKSVSAKDLDSAERAPLRGIDGGGEGDGRPVGDLSAVDDKEQALFGGSGSKASGWYKGDEKPGFIKGLFGSFQGKVNKKSTTIGLIAGGLIGGGMIGLSVIQGPLMFIHLSQILQRNLFSQEDSTSSRYKGFLRYARTGDVGETRVGRTGSKIFGDTMNKLKAQGIDFSDRNKFTGRPNSIKFDASKHPATKGLPSIRAKAELARYYGISSNEIRPTGRAPSGAALFEIDTRGAGASHINKVNNILSKSLPTLEDGKILTAIKTRTLKRFFKLPRLFNPLAKRTDTGQRVGNFLQTREERKKAEQERRKERNGPTNQKITDAKNKVKSKINSNQNKIGGALIGYSGVCIARSIAKAIPIVNRASIVNPSAVDGVDKTAIGSKIQSGDAPIGALAGPSESMVDKNGKNFFAGMALQATSGKINPSGEDLPLDYKQAFYNTDLEKDIENDFNPGIPSTVLSIACSTPAQFIAAGVGLATLVAGCNPVSDVATAGSTCVAAVAKAGAGAAASSLAIALLSDPLLDAVTKDEIQEFSGPLGGNLDAYGFREASNISARASGGIPLSDSESALLDYRQQQNDRSEFQQKSFVARVFDVYDHRSLASRIIDESSTSPTQNISNVASGLLNIGSVFGRTFSALMPEASAATSNYDWGFPRYGIPQEVLQDEKYEDPYLNAKKAASILNSGVGEDYIEKAKKCFGVNINKDGGVWTVIAEEDVNPQSHEYHKAKCTEKSENWHRIQLFVFDTRLVDSVACYEGDDEACANVDATSESSDTNSPDSSLAGGDAQELASKILDSGKVTGDSRYMGQIRAVAKGDDSCHVNPTILQLIATIIEKGYSINISSLNRKCTGVLTASGEASYHYADGGGHAVDISIINGKATTGRDTNAQKLLRDIMPALPKGTGIGQSNCSGDITLLDGITEFSDSCNHLHIQVPKK